VDSVFPTSIGGWVGLIAGSTALVLLVVDRLTARGKNLATIDRKIDGLCGDIEDMKDELKAVDGLAKSVQELTQEWRGVGDNNGYRALIRDSSRRIRVIEERNNRLDAVREEDERRSGGQHRRLMDEELSKILPEKREEKS
jgi:hypothetical protein